MMICLVFLHRGRLATFLRTLAVPRFLSDMYRYVPIFYALFFYEISPYMRAMPGVQFEIPEEVYRGAGDKGIGVMTRVSLTPNVE